MGLEENDEWDNPELDNINYDPVSGGFWWVKVPRGAKADGSCGSVHKDARGYRSVYIKAGKYRYRAHRIAWYKVYGLPVPDEIDHLDGDATNNKISNLKKSDSLDNKRNRHMQKNNSSGVTGVRKSSVGRGWDVNIQVRGERIYLGYFMDFDKAASVRLQAEKEYGFTSRHGKNKRADHE